MKLKCILIDDESDATDLMKRLITDFCSEKAEVVGVANSVLNGNKLIRNNPPDVLFLDIEMPDASGFDLVEMFPDRNFKIVFVSAYEKHALKAIKIKPYDYLLKPVGIEEIVNLMNALYAEQMMNNESKGLNKIKIPVKDGSLFIEPSEIIYIKGEGRYSTVCLNGSLSYVVTKNIGLFEKELASNKFLRVHKSYLVNLNHIKKINHTDGSFLELSDGISIEISRRKKKDLMLALNTGG